MQTKAKSNSVVTSFIPEGTPMIDLTISIPAEMVFNILGYGEERFDLTKVSAENMGRACVHGWNQRIPDAAAVGKSDDEGNIIPEEERTLRKGENISGLIAHYTSGTAEWSRKPTGDGSGSRSITIEAIARVKGIDYPAAKELAQQHADMHYKGDTKKALAFLRTGKRVAEAIVAIRNERASRSAGSADADAMLDEMTQG